MKWFVLSFIFIYSYSWSQKEEYKEPSLPIDSATKTITYTKVISVNAHKDSLFRKGKSWFFSYFKNPTGVIRQEDPTNGQIIGKHQIKVLNPPDKNNVQTMRGIVQYTVTTQYKDNKARIVVNEINLKETSYTPIEKWLDKTSPSFTTKNYYYLEQIDKEIKAMIKHFEEYLTKPTTPKKEEW
ncbi:MAG: DUF4468 domain-containing protein [Bacteroidales bacterium]|nr:DUF4468 domain-containing protein [Bacteroidales bacterium]